MSIRLTKNGRSIPLNSFADEMMKDVRQFATAKIRENVERTLRGIECPDHPRAATVRVTLENGMEHGKVTVDPCCDKVEAAIKAVMGEEGAVGDTPQPDAPEEV